MRYIVPLYFSDEHQLVWAVGEGETPEKAIASAIKGREARGEFDEVPFQWGGEPLDADELEEMAKSLREGTDVG